MSLALDKFQRKRRDSRGTRTAKRQRANKVEARFTQILEGDEQ
jgi:hypothetical protein